MDEYHSTTTRPITEVNPQNPPKVYAPQTVIIRGVKADGRPFHLDIGRICYLDRLIDSKRLNRRESGDNSYVVKSVNVDSLSLGRTLWLRNYLDTTLRKGYRDETLRGKLYDLRYFFYFCDFDGGITPETFDELVCEYQRYQIVLDQRGRIKGESSLSISYIQNRLLVARDFIQEAFQLSNNDITYHIPKYRCRSSKVMPEVKSISLQEGQNYLRACGVYFNQFSDAILENNYPVHVTPPNSSCNHLYWDSARSSLRNLSNCFTKDGDLLPYKEIKETLMKNLINSASYTTSFYRATLVNNRNAWRSGALTRQKIHSYNLSVFFFFHTYLGFTGANIQPTLDLKISDIDLDKIGSTTFAKKHKFRAGRAVHFTAPSHLKREILKYLRLREWADNLGLAGGAEDYLFATISTRCELRRLERSLASCIIKKSTLFEGITKLASSDVRDIASEYFIRKSGGKISLVAKKLNNSITTAARSYTAIDIETQAQEMYRFHEELDAKIRQFNRTTSSPVPVEMAMDGSAERVATGSCINIEGRIPTRADGFNNEAPEPSCGTFESCLFCEYFAIHKDFEDIHKILSLREALHTTSVIRNDQEHHEAVIQPAIFRINEIMAIVSEKDSVTKALIVKAEEALMMGNYSKYWNRQIKILINRANNLDRKP